MFENNNSTHTLAVPPARAKLVGATPAFLALVRGGELDPSQVGDIWSFAYLADFISRFNNAP